MTVINKTNFESTINSDKIVVVDFFATWCKPCKMLAPILEGVANKNPDVIFAKLDIDEAPEIAGQYLVQSVPTLVSFKNGKELKRVVGVVQEDEIINLTK